MEHDLENFSSFPSPNNVSSDNTDSFTPERLMNTAAIVDYYYTPLLCLLGAMGNCLSVTVFCFNVNHRNLSSSFYLSALAISDTGFLLQVFAVWVDGLGVEILSTHLGCPLLMYGGQVTCFLSVWLTVAFTVERFVAVCSPLHRNRMCTVSKAKKVIAGLTVFAFIALSYVLVIAQVGDISALGEEDYSFMNNETVKSHLGNSTSLLQTNPEHWTPLDHTIEGIPSFETYKAEQRTCPLGQENGTCKNLFIADGETGPEKIIRDIGQPTLVKSHKRGGSEMDTISSGWRTDIPDLNITYAEDAIKQNVNETQKIRQRRPILVCTVPLEYMTISTIANYLDSTITLIIPFCLIAYFNMRISVCVWKLKEQRQDLLALSKINTKNKRYIGEPVKGRVQQNNQNQAPQTYDNSTTNTQATRVKCTRSSQLNYSDSILAVDESLTWKSNELCTRQLIAQDEAEATGSSGSPTLARCSYDINLCLQNRTAANKEAYNPNEETVRKSDQVKIESRFVINSSVEAYPREDQTVKMEIAIDGRGISDCNQILHSGSTPAIRTCCNLQDPIKEQLVVSTTAKELSFKPSKNLPTTNLISNSKMLANEMEEGDRRMSSKKGQVTIQNHSASEARVTKMLLLVSTVFLVLNLPSHAFRAASFVQRLFFKEDTQSQNWLLAAQQISNIFLFNTSFAVNFLLYCLSGRNFRNSLRNIIFGRSTKKTSYHWISGKTHKHPRKAVQFNCSHTARTGVDNNDESIA